MSVETEAALAKYTALATEGKQDQVVLIGGYHTHGKVSTFDSLYRFEINVPRFIELLQREFKLTPEQIGRIEIHIVGEDWSPKTRQERKEIYPYGNPIKTPLEKVLGDDDLYAVKNDVGDKILFNFYTNLLWCYFNKDKKAILSYAKLKRKEGRHREALDKKTELFSFSPRFFSYLEKTPADRIEAFLSRLMIIKARRELLRSLAHEADHIRRDEKDKNSFWNKQWVVDVLYSLGRFIPPIEDFLEGEPKKKEEEIVKKTEWLDVLEFRINAKAA